MLLAHQKNEAQQLAFAIQKVKEYEKKLQRDEERKANGDRRCRVRYTELVSAANARRTSRNTIRAIVDEVAHALHRSLKRYVLRKHATASFSMTISKQKFRQLFQGFGEIKANKDGTKMLFTLRDCTILYRKL
jgi:hypothetical protein